ncbi:MAG TPA: YihY/virulence factor BrkB family protein [Terracidiphilus sp.]
MSDISNNGTDTNPPTPDATTVETVGVVQAVEPPQSKWFQWRRNGVALISYLLDSEVHTFAFSVAANAIISFIPFIILLYTLAHSLFHSPDMALVIDEMVRYFLPSNQKFVADTLERTASHHGIQWLSLVMILVSCTGIFLPLEVALNQAWGVTKSRNYIMNQLVAFGLAILMVLLGMGSVLLATAQRAVLGFIFFGHTDNVIYWSISYVWLAISTGIASIIFFFSIYWLLPNRRIPPRKVLRTSIITGIVWLLSKNVFVAILPHMDLSALYGPFYVSVGLLFWAYTSGLILFAGAQFSVARFGAGKE